MLPREYAPRFALTAADLFRESDPLTREIFAFGEAVQGRVEAEVAKAVVDLNRDPTHLPPRVLYGAIKKTTAHERPVWTEEGFPSPDEMERLLDRYHRPYHEVLSRTAGRGAIRLAIDCHSMNPVGPPISSDVGELRPMFRLGNLGDATGGGPGVTAPPELMQFFSDLLTKEFTDVTPPTELPLVAMNQPNLSDYTLRRHGKGRTPWIQLDLNRALYVKEPEDGAGVPDAERETIAALRRRLFAVMSELAARLD